MALQKQFQKKNDFVFPSPNVDTGVVLHCLQIPSGFGENGRDKKGETKMKRKLVCLSAVLMLSCRLFLCPAAAVQTSSEAGGIHILKTDLTGAVLEGASFQIIRELEDGDLTDSSVEKKLVKIDGENRIMSVEKFWDNRDMTGQLHTAVTTDRNGRAAIYGLPFGTYYLVETAAPVGYSRITEPVRISIHKYSHLTESDCVKDDKGDIIDNTLHIINVRYILPDTGNWGVMQLTAAGVGIVFSSAALLILNWKRWR